MALVMHLHGPDCRLSQSLYKMVELAYKGFDDINIGEMVIDRLLPSGCRTIDSCMNCRAYRLRQLFHNLAMGMV